MRLTEVLLPRVRLALTLLAVVALATACAVYRPKPLDPGKTLTVPSPEDLRVRAAELHHPALPPVVIDVSDGITADEAAVLAVLLNPSLRAERDRLALADAQLIQARVLPNPQFAYARDVPTGGPGFVTAFAGNLSMSVNELLTRRTRVTAADAERASVALDIAWREWQVAEDAKVAIYRLVALEERERLAADAAARAEDVRTLVKAAADAGQLTAPDIAAAESAAKDSRSTLLETRMSLDAQRQDLDRILGVPTSSTWTVAKGIALPEHVEAIPLPELESGIEEHRLDLQALRLGYTSQEAALHAEVLAQFPRLSIGAGRARDTSNVTTNGLSFTLDLPLFDRNQGPIAAATATRQQLFDEYTARVAEARADAAAASSELTHLGQRIVAAKESEEAFRALEESYRTALAEGHATVLDYNTAWNQYQAARLDSLALRASLEEARVRLELAAGLYRIDRAQP